MVSLIDMTLGMILGIALSPIMMKVIKNFRQRRKVKKILQEFANNRKNDIDNENNKSTTALIEKNDSNIFWHRFNFIFKLDKILA